MMIDHFLKKRGYILYSHFLPVRGSFTLLAKSNEELMNGLL
ncbi:hypothetical protein BACFIN_07932 [Bacteroides finegoldii DSM 17565]|nr:hypothetical protein BACFIN_07932 [Bacteroides finegoldii DSM 17565]